MIYLPIKEASKYIKRETGIKFSDYELARIGCRGYLDFYLDSYSLTGFKLAVSEIFLSSFYGNFPFDMLYPIQDDYLKIAAPVMQDDGKIYFDGVYSASIMDFFSLVTLPSRLYDALSLDNKEPYRQKREALSFLQEEISKNENGNKGLLCDLLEDTDTKDGARELDELKVTLLYISLDDTHELVKIIKGEARADLKKTKREQQHLSISELWELGSETEQKDLFISLAEKRAKNGYLTLDDLKKIRPLRGAGDAEKQAIRRWKNKAIDYAKTKI